MTYAAQIAEDASEGIRLDELQMGQAAIESGEDVWLNGMRLDLRHPRLMPPQNWRAIGLCLKFNGDASSLWIGWSSSGRASNDRGTAKDANEAGVWLSPGDILFVDQVVVENLGDPVLMEFDRARAEARVKIVRADGREEWAAAPIEFAYPLLMELESGLAVRSYWRLRRRLALLEDKHQRNPSGYDAKALSALQIAKELFGELRLAVIEASKPLAPSAVSIITISNLAAAFGYAVGLAEAEFSVRPIVRAGRRKRIEGGRARAKQQQALAEEWKAAALKIAKENDRGPRMLTREALAMRILRALESKSLVAMPSRHSIVIWLQNEAEEPNGPLRSRRRRRSGT